jgi:Holliday junction resolvase
MRNNRTAGHNWEREIIRILKDMGYDAVSARYESRRADDRGIDVISDFPYRIQAKISQNQPNCHSILTDKDCDVIFFRKVEKAKKNFIAKGDYAMLKLDDFLDLVGVKSSFTEKDRDDE